MPRRRVVTLDADLQNPPEEIRQAARGDGRRAHDYVGSIRRDRQDVGWRTLGLARDEPAARTLTGIEMTDHGCMLRAYSRDVIEPSTSASEINTFIPALAYHVRQEPDRSRGRRTKSAHAGESKYSLYSLIRLNFDLVTGFSLVPLQAFSMLGLVVSLRSGLLFVILAGRRLILGPEVATVCSRCSRWCSSSSASRCSASACWASTSAASTRKSGARPRYLVSAILERRQ